MQLQNKTEDSIEESTKYSQNGFARSHIKDCTKVWNKIYTKAAFGQILYVCKK